MWKGRKKNRPEQQDESGTAPDEDAVSDWLTTDEMNETRRLVDDAIRFWLRSELTRLAARIRTDAYCQEASADPGWRAGMDRQPVDPNRAAHDDGEDGKRAH